jgi:probable addiction module antidote protein
VTGGRPSGSGSRSAKRRTTKPSRKLLPFEAARYLTDDDAVSEYLNAVLETGDSDLLLLALGDIARPRGMAQVAKDTGLGRESLYKALSPGAMPRFDTVLKVARALGVKLTAQTAAHQRDLSPIYRAG